MGTWLRIRRRELHLSQQELADKAGIRSLKTLNSAEAGRSEITRHVAEVEQVLGWQPGSLTRAYQYGTRPTLDGQAPAPQRPPIGEELDDLMQRLADIRARIDEEYPLPPPPDDAESKRRETG